MQPISFTAASAEQAVAQIRAQLGPEAIVLNVRPLPANGLARLWQKPMIEVLACKPEAPAPIAPPITDVIAEFRQQLDELKQQVAGAARAPSSELQVPSFRSDRESEERPALPQPFPLGEGESAAAVFPTKSVSVDHANASSAPNNLLEKSGMLALYAQQVLDATRARHGENQGSSIEEEIGRVKSVLAQTWRKPAPLTPHSLHVLIGPAGSGKTTCLCKWLTQAALVEGQRARVWRLDGATANMAESLSIYCEILGVPSERAWQSGGLLAEDLGFIDLPGVDWRNPVALKELAGQLKQMGSPRVHLVLNGAYESQILLAQARAFGVLPVEDLIVTHLDEEPRWGKMWNLVLGTNYPIRHLSTGQNIPGDFCAASPETIFSRQFPNKQRVS